MLRDVRLIQQAIILGVSQIWGLRTRHTTLSSSTFGSPSQCQSRTCHRRLWIHRIVQIHRVAGRNNHDNLIVALGADSKFLSWKAWWSLMYTSGGVLDFVISDAIVVGFRYCILHSRSYAPFLLHISRVSAITSFNRTSSFYKVVKASFL